jgi:hypothetical protein
MNTAHAEAPPRRATHKDGTAAGRLGPWNDALKALPILEALRPSLKARPLWAGIRDSALVIATRDNVVPFEPDGHGTPMALVPERLPILDEPAAIAAIIALRPVSGSTGVSVIGLEGEALADLLAVVKPSAELGAIFVNEGGSSLRLIELARANALLWSKETLARMKAYLHANEFSELPASCLECASDIRMRTRENIETLRHLIREKAGSFCKEHGLTVAGYMSRIRQDLHERLGIACNAFRVGYLLRTAANVVSEAELGGLRAITEFGIVNVERYRHFSTAIAGADAEQREKMAKKIIRLVGRDCEEEVRGSFHAPAPTPGVVVPWKAPPAPAAPAAPMAVRRAQVQRLSADEQVAAIAKELPDLPAGFIARWVKMGMRNPERIQDKYDRFLMHPGTLAAPGGRRQE